MNKNQTMPSMKKAINNTVPPKIFTAQWQVLTVNIKSNKMSNIIKVQDVNPSSLSLPLSWQGKPPFAFVGEVAGMS